MRNLVIPAESNFKINFERVRGSQTKSLQNPNKRWDFDFSEKIGNQFIHCEESQKLDIFYNDSTSPYETFLSDN